MGMKDKQNIFYAFERTDREVKRFCEKRGIEISKHSTGVDLIFIDVKATDRAELTAVLAKCRAGVIVYLFQLSDLGVGAKAAQMRKEIEAKGATVMVPEKVSKKRGPPPAHSLTAAQIEHYRPLYDTKALTRQHVCNVILREANVKLSIGQLNRAFAK